MLRRQWRRVGLKFIAALRLAAPLFACVVGANAACSDQTGNEIRSVVGEWSKIIQRGEAVSVVYRHGDTSDYSWVLFDPASGVFVCATPRQVVARTFAREYLWKESPNSPIRSMTTEEQQGKALDALLDPFMSGPLVMALDRDWEKWVVSSEQSGDRVLIRTRYPSGMRYLACDRCEPKSQEATVQYEFTADGRLLSTQRVGHAPRPFASEPGDRMGVLTKSGDYPGAGSLVKREVPTAQRIRGLTGSSIAKAVTDEITRPRSTFHLPPAPSARESKSGGQDAESVRERRWGTAIALAGGATVLIALLARLRRRAA